MVNNLEEGVKVVEVLEAEEGDEADKPSVEHFRVFGCISHVHMLDGKKN